MTENKPCYEFLAAFEEWENTCNASRSVKNIVIEGTSLKVDSWTKQALIKSTLIRFEKSLQETMKQGCYSYSKNTVEIPKYFLPCDAPEKDAAILSMPRGSLLLKFNINLTSPFMSKDDLDFYYTENPLRRHWVFETPYLSAAGLKGLLRWAHRMNLGSSEEDDVSKALYGNASDDQKSSSNQGMVYSYPIYWKGNIGADIINKQNTETLAGSNPVKYEILKLGASGTIYLFLPFPIYSGDVSLYKQCVSALLDDIEWLLSEGAISAKKTAGWGQIDLVSATAGIRYDGLPEEEKPKEMPKDQSPVSKKNDEALWNKYFKVKNNEKVLLSKEEIKKNPSLAPWNLLGNVSKKKWEKEPDKYYAEFAKKAQEFLEKQKKEEEHTETQQEPSLSVEPEKKAVHKLSSVSLSNIQGKIEWESFKEQILKKITESQNG